MDAQKTIDDLNFLIAVNADRIDQFQAAKHDAKTERLQKLFQQIAVESAGHIASLTDLIRQVGGEVERGTTLPGSLHRLWVEVKSLVSGHASGAILDAVRCAEKSTLHAYDRILEDANQLPEHVLELIQQQRRTIQESCMTVEQLGAQPTPG